MLHPITILFYHNCQCCWMKRISCNMHFDFCLFVLIFCQVDLMRNISTIPQPFLYTRHVHYLNFTRWANRELFIWMYLIRTKIKALLPFKLLLFDSVLILFVSFFFRFRIEQPVYINIIRDPINRFLSNYFFRRFGDWRGEQNHLIRTPQMKDDERYLVRRSF